MRSIFTEIDLKKIKNTKGDYENDVILTSRARIARNLSDFCFSSINEGDEKRKILKIVRESFFEESLADDFVFYNISRLNKIQRRFLVEKHILSPEMLTKLAGKAIILSFDINTYNKSTSILINEEDHLRIQSIYPGLNIENACREIYALEKVLEKKLKFAFDKEFGYLTSCPTNLGTALRISVIAHLPGLIISGQIEQFVQNITKIGCNIRGFYGENSEVIGNLFQISNQNSLGKYENHIIDDMKAICANIVDEERKAIEKLRAEKNLSIEDGVYRSYGILKYAKLLSYGEALELLSMISLGTNLGILKGIKPFNFYQLISLLGESNIILRSNGEIEPDTDEADKKRMDIIKEIIL